MNMGGQPIPALEQLRERLSALSDRLLQESIPHHIQPELYHYTTVEGLHGIVESNRLRATSAYHLNDSSEIEYGCRLAAEVGEEWSKPNQDNRSLSLMAIRALSGIFVNPSSRVYRYMGVYVSCFCEGGNLLSQWRAYGQAGGYAIGFYATDLELGLRAPGIFDTRLLKVTYDERKQRDGIHAILRSFIEEVEGAGVEIPADPAALTKLLTPLLSMLQEVILDKIVAYKHPAFEEEREWRIIARPRVIDFQQEQRGEPTGSGVATALGVAHRQHQLSQPVKYRTSKGVLIPFIELERPDQRLPIRSVRFGPSLDKIRTESSLKGFLARNGYGGQAGVFGCDTPVLL